MAQGPGLRGSLALLALAAGVAVLAVTCGTRMGPGAVAVRTGAARPAPGPLATGDSAARPAPAAGSGSIVGAVVRGEYDVPDAGRVVTLLADGAAPRTATPDGWGRFRFDGVAAGLRVALHAEAEGCAAEHVPGVVLLAGETRDVGTLRLDEPALFRIEVVDGAGRPLAGVTVDAFRAPTGPLSDHVGRMAPQTPDVPSITGTTDAEGHAVFAVAPMRSFTFAASAPGLARVAVAWNFRRAGVRDELRLTLPAPVRLTGRVLDEDDRPAPRAVVVARAVPPVVDDYHGTRAEGPGLWTRADADDEGRFAFDALPPGPVQFLAAAEGGVPTGWESVDTRNVTEIVLRAHATGRIAGRVTDDATGAPVAGATVATRLQGAAWLAVTAADGSYEMPGVAASDLGDTWCVPPAGWRMPDAPALHGDERPEVERGRTLRLDWTVRRAAVVEGRVTADGVPVLGAFVAVLRVPDTPGDARWEADGRTDGDGMYRIDDAPVGRVAVCATPPGASVYDTEDAFRSTIVKDAAARALAVFDTALGVAVRRDVAVAIPQREVRDTLDERMERMADRMLGERRVRVVCRVRTADGVPLRDARVRAGPAELMDWRVERLQFGTPVPPDGICEVVERAQDGDQTFAVAAADADHDITFVRDVAVAADAKEVTVEIVLEPLPVLRCCVVSNGDPVAGAEVRAAGALVARSAADGTFALRRNAGTCRLSVEAKGCVRQEFTEIEVPQEGVLDLVLDSAESIEGVVVDAEGRPLAGVRVAPVDGDGGVALPYGASWTSPSPPRLPVTGADGRFRIAELASGAYGLRMSAAVPSEAAVATLTSKPVETGTPDVRLVARRPSRIAGRVVDATGKGVARARVACAGDDEGTSEEDRLEVRTASDGSFEFPGLLEGRYRIDVRPVPRDALVPARFRMAAGRGDVVLALVPAGVLTGVVVTPEGRPVPHAWIVATEIAPVEEDAPRWEGRFEDWGGEDGRFRIVVPPGRRYALAFSTNSPRGDDAVLRGGEDVAADGSDLRLVAVTGLAFGGNVLTEKGKDVFDADIEVTVAGAVVRRYRTGGNGRFKISGFDPCTADLAIHAPGRVPRLLRGVKAGTTDLEIVLPVGDSITGRLLDARGEPATAWKVRARRVADPGTDLWRTVVRRDGEFSIPGLDEGEWTLDAVVEQEGRIERSVPLGTARTGARNLQFKLAE